MSVTPRVRVPATASAGEVVSIRTLVSHPMHTGFMEDSNGEIIPRRIINRFTCEFEGESVVDMEIAPGVAHDPYIEFDLRVEQSGTLAFAWHDDDGAVYTQDARIEVA